MLPTLVGVELTTSWSPVRRASSWATEAWKTVEVVETQTLLCHVYTTKFMSKSRVCNSSNKNMIRVLWPLCTYPAYILIFCKFQIIILKTVGEVAETQTLLCHVYKTNFLSKSRVCSYTYNNWIKVLCICSVYILAMVQVSNHNLENCRSCRDTNSTIKCDWRTNTQMYVWWRVKLYALLQFVAEV